MIYALLAARRSDAYYVRNLSTRSNTVAKFLVFPADPGTAITRPDSILPAVFALPLYFRQSKISPLLIDTGE